MSADSDGVLEDGPLDGFGAWWGGEGSFVSVEVGEIDAFDQVADGEVEVSEGSGFVALERDKGV